MKKQPKPVQQEGGASLSKKQMMLENTPFVAIGGAVLAMMVGGALTKALAAPLLFAIIGAQQAYSAVRFYGGSPKMRRYYFVCSAISFAAALFLYLNSDMLR